MADAPTLPADILLVFSLLGRGKGLARPACRGTHFPEPGCWEHNLQVEGLTDCFLASQEQMYFYIWVFYSVGKYPVRLSPYVGLGKGRLDAVGQLFNGDTKFLPALANRLGSFLQLTAVHCSQVLITKAILNTAQDVNPSKFDVSTLPASVPALLGPRLLLAVVLFLEVLLCVNSLSSQRCQVCGSRNICNFNCVFSILALGSMQSPYSMVDRHQDAFHP
jgi:hypothetical protein